MRENVTMTSTFTHTYTSIDSRGEGGRLPGTRGEPQTCSLRLFWWKETETTNGVAPVKILIGGGGGGCLRGNLWYSPPANMTSRLALETFKMVSKIVTEETDKNFDFITEILFRYLGFGDFKVSIVIEN